MKFDKEKFEKSFSVCSVMKIRIRGGEKRAKTLLFDSMESAREVFNETVEQYKVMNPNCQVYKFVEQKNSYDEVYRTKIHFTNEYKDGRFENVLYSFQKVKVYEKLAS